MGSWDVLLLVFVYANVPAINGTLMCVSFDNKPQFWTVIYKITSVKIIQKSNSERQEVKKFKNVNP